MEDWRLRGQEDYLSGATFCKVTFPDFWQRAWREKNRFYQKIEADGRRYVEATGRAREYLEGEKIRLFWHEHCEFCWDKVMTDDTKEFYCTEDLHRWVCPECFRDFREKFRFREGTAEDIIL